jgi:hypothetical protein
MRCESAARRFANRKTRRSQTGIEATSPVSVDDGEMNLYSAFSISRIIAEI